jgi:hypothetical protein
MIQARIIRLLAYVISSSLMVHISLSQGLAVAGMKLADGFEGAKHCIGACAQSGHLGDTGTRKCKRVTVMCYSILVVKQQIRENRQ